MLEMQRDNYYILLGLGFDPPATDVGQIKAALRAKRQEWTRWQDHPGKRNAGLAFLSEAAEIERVMLDPTLREKEAQAAKEIKRDMLLQFEAELRVLESKGYILPREASAIAAKYKAYGVTKELVQDSAKCPVSETPPAPKDDDGGEILDRVTAKNIGRSLRILGFSTLYAFLGEPQYSSIKKLLAAAEQIRRSSAAQGGKSSHATISAELAGICSSLFESIQSKQTYDRYLKVSKYPAVGELLDEEAARAGYINPDVLLRIVNFAVEKYGVKVLEAEEFIKNYSAAYGIPLDVRGINISCPNCRNKTPRQNHICDICAQPLKGLCPECGEAFEGGAAICPECGFKLGDMGKGLTYIGDAENALIENNWSTARRALLYVKKYWPRHPKLELMEKRAALLEERYSGYVNSIHDCIRQRQLYAARELVDEALSRNIKMPTELVKSVGVEIAAFEKRVETLTQEGSPDVESLLKLSLEVTDSIELGRLLASYPPEPPCESSADILGMQVALSWGESPSAYTDTYLLVRKKNSMPLTAFDGDLLYEGPAHFFTDTTALPLITYHYSLFSKRAGTYSRTAVQFGPLMIIPEIQNLKLLPMDTGARLTWDFNPDVREIKIWRKLGGDTPTGPGDGILLPNDRLDGFSDTRLKNDVEYWYYVVAGYVVDGVPIFASGVCGTVVPRKLIAPVEELNIIEAGGEGEYIVSWNTDAHSDILMFCTPTRPDFGEGDLLLVEDLLTRYRKLDLDYKNAGSAHFSLGFSGGMYLFAASVFGRFATISEPRYIVSVADVQNLTCDIIGESLYINMKWPVTVNNIILAYKFGRFPEAPDETGAASIACSREQYDYNAAVIINDAAQKVYHITVFSEFTSPTGQKVYSKGARIIVNNQPQQEIFYNFAYKKKRFTDSGVLDVMISSLEEFVMPKAVIVGRVGRMPLSRTDGLPLFELQNDMIVPGSVSMQFGTTPLPSNIFVRLFLDDDAMYGKFRLVPTAAIKIT